MLVNQPCDKLLKISVYNRYPNQTLGVHLDQNKEWLLREPLPKGDIRMYDYRHFEVPLHLTAGSHILRLTYTNCNPDTAGPKRSSTGNSRSWTCPQSPRRGPARSLSCRPSSQ